METHLNITYISPINCLINGPLKPCIVYLPHHNPLRYRLNTILEEVEPTSSVSSSPLPDDKCPSVVESSKAGSCESDSNATSLRKKMQSEKIMERRKRMAKKLVLDDSSTDEESSKENRKMFLRYPRKKLKNKNVVDGISKPTMNDDNNIVASNNQASPFGLSHSPLLINSSSVGSCKPLNTSSFRYINVIPSASDSIERSKPQSNPPFSTQPVFSNSSTLLPSTVSLTSTSIVSSTPIVLSVSSPSQQKTLRPIHLSSSIRPIYVPSSSVASNTSPTPAPHKKNKPHLKITLTSSLSSIIPIVPKTKDKSPSMKIGNMMDIDSKRDINSKEENRLFLDRNGVESDGFEKVYERNKYVDQQNGTASNDISMNFLNNNSHDKLTNKKSPIGKIDSKHEIRKKRIEILTKESCFDNKRFSSGTKTLLSSVQNDNQSSSNSNKDINDQSDRFKSSVDGGCEFLSTYNRICSKDKSNFKEIIASSNPIHSKTKPYKTDINFEPNSSTNLQIKNHENPFKKELEDDKASKKPCGDEKIWQEVHEFLEKTEFRIEAQENQNKIEKNEQLNGNKFIGKKDKNVFKNSKVALVKQDAETAQIHQSKTMGDNDIKTNEKPLPELPRKSNANISININSKSSHSDMNSSETNMKYYVDNKNKDTRVMSSLGVLNHSHGSNKKIKNTIENKNTIKIINGNSRNINRTESTGDSKIDTNDLRKISTKNEQNNKIETQKTKISKPVYSSENYGKNSSHNNNHSVNSTNKHIVKLENIKLKAPPSDIEQKWNKINQNKVFRNKSTGALKENGRIKQKEKHCINEANDTSYSNHNTKNQKVLKPLKNTLYHFNASLEPISMFSSEVDELFDHQNQQHKTVCEQSKVERLSKNPMSLSETELIIWNSLQKLDIPLWYLSYPNKDKELVGLKNTRSINDMVLDIERLSIPPIERTSKDFNKSASSLHNVSSFSHDPKTQFTTRSLSKNDCYSFNTFSELKDDFVKSSSTVSLSRRQINYRRAINNANKEKSLPCSFTLPSDKLRSRSSHSLQPMRIKNFEHIMKDVKMSEEKKVTHEKLSKQHLPSNFSSPDQVVRIRRIMEASSRASLRHFRGSDDVLESERLNLI